MLAAWSAQYRRSVPDVEIDYDAAGSPQGVEALVAGTVDFAATDVPLTGLEEVLLGGSATLVQVPWVAGAIGVVYNLPGVEELGLSPGTVAGIFAGDIVRWDDPEIRRDNPEATLPGVPIRVFHRSEPSSTTLLFTTYLRETVRWSAGTAAQIDWPVGQGVEGSAGVAAAVAGTEGAVGYVQTSFATARALGVARLRNQAGNYVAASPESVRAALAAATQRRFRATFDLYFLPDSPASYPLSTVSYVLYRRDLEDPAKQAAMRHFVEWVLGEGQRLAELEGYAPLPLFIRKVAAEALLGPGNRLTS